MRHVHPLEVRRLFASFTASSVAELIADINTANAAGGSNSITLAAGSTFNLVAVDNQTDFDGDNGLPIIAAGDDLTIVGNGATIGRSTARGTPEFRLFDMAVGASLTLNNLTLSRGVGRFSAGGVVNRGTLSIQGVTIANCASRGWSLTDGGGITSSGTLTIANSTITNNQALGDNGWVNGITAYPGGRAYGGGVYIGGGAATITNSTFSGNLAQGGNGADGFIIHGKGGFFSGGIAGAPGGDGYGGGLYVAGGTVQITGSTFTGNSAQGGNGGNSPKGLKKAANGIGQAGGIYIAPGTAVTLDSSTVARTTGNIASTSDNDIFGSYSIL